MLSPVLEGALEAMAGDMPTLERGDRWHEIRADEIEPMTVVRDPGWAPFSLGDSTRMALVESRLAPARGSRDAELGMVTFAYVDVTDRSYRNWAAYLPHMILQVWR